MDKLDANISEYHLLKHPFYQRWMDGTLKLEELQTYAKQYWAHVDAFPAYVSAAHSHAKDQKLRHALLDNLIEEEQGDENHPELWVRFGEMLGLQRDAIKSSSPLSSTTHLVETFDRLTKADLPSALGALYAYESQVPEIATQKIAGLKENYGLSDARGLRFFEVHEKADVYHSQTSREAIEKMSEEDQAKALAAADEASKALWNFLSGIDLHHGHA